MLEIKSSDEVTITLPHNAAEFKIKMSSPETLLEVQALGKTKRDVSNLDIQFIRGDDLNIAIIASLTVHVSQLVEKVNYLVKSMEILENKLEKNTECQHEFIVAQQTGPNRHIATSICRKCSYSP